MADSKISQLPLLSSPAGNDEFYVVDSSSTPTSKKVTIDVFVGNIPSNTSVAGTFAATGNASFSGANNSFSGNTTFQDVNGYKMKVTGNTFVIENSYTPANSTTPTALRNGTIQWDSNYLYVRTSNTAWKRVALSSF